MMAKKILSTLTMPVALLAAGHFTADMYAGFIIPILPLLAKKLDISLPMAGLIISLSGLTSSFLQPIYGYLSDKISRRFFIVWGLIISSVFISFIGIANSYLTLVLFVIIGNLGVGLYHPQSTAYVGKLKSKSTNKMMGVYVAGGIAGFALGPMVSSIIVEFLGLNWILISSIPGLILVVLIYIYLPKIKIENPKFHFSDVIEHFNERKSILIPIILIVIIRSFILVSMSTYLPFEWEDNLGYSILTVGIIMTLSSFTGGISSIVGSFLPEILGEKCLMIGSFLIAFPILFSSFFFLGKLDLLSFALYIIGSAFLFSTISINIVIGQRVVSKYMGIISGITGGFCWGIAGFMMFPLGFAISNLGFIPVMNGVISLSFLAILLIQFIPKDVFQENNLLKKGL